MKCSVCTHPDREKIDNEIVSGTPNRRIATQYGISEASIRRHKAGDHIPVSLARAQDAQQIASADSILTKVQSLNDRTIIILQQAEASGDLRTACMAIREARGCLELLAKVMGEIDTAPVVTVIQNPEWISIRTIVLSVLAPYPEARTKLISALNEVSP